MLTCVAKMGEGSPVKVDPVGHVQSKLDILDPNPHLSSVFLVVEPSKITFTYIRYYTPKGGYSLTLTIVSPNKTLLISTVTMF